MTTQVLQILNQQVGQLAFQAVVASNKSLDQVYDARHDLCAYLGKHAGAALRALASEELVEDERQPLILESFAHSVVLAHACPECEGVLQVR